MFKGKYMHKLIDLKPRRKPIQEQPKFKREHLLEFYERYKNNFTYNKKQNWTEIRILGPNDLEISKIVLMPKDNNTWFIGDLSTGNVEDKENILRNLGFAKALMNEAVKYVKSQGGTKLIFSATLPMIQFYERLGARRDKLFSHHTFPHILIGLYPMSFDLTTYNPKNYP
jgi:hypothetical protein